MYKYSYILVIVLSLLFSCKIYSSELDQQDTIKATVADNQDSTIVTADENQDSTSLLPNKFLFTQKLLWGKKGLMRNFDSFKLSTEARDKELNIRSKFLVAHQILAGGSLVGMVGLGITGQLLYKGNNTVKTIHEADAAYTNITYFSALALALFTPPPMKDRPKGMSKLKVHKILSLVHLASMITTDVLAGMVEDNPSIKPFHRASAITAFGSLLIATAVIKL
ncbi:MAG: hypothetical protein IPO21_04100 [Bacteroidales bacterium]|nr:hypothetical protein [Bacteroidales bacterium]